MSYVGEKVRPELDPYPDLREDYYGELIPDEVNNACVTRMCLAKPPTDLAGDLPPEKTSPLAYLTRYTHICLISFDLCA